MATELEEAPTQAVEALSQQQIGKGGLRDLAVSCLMRTDPGLGFEAMLRWDIRGFSPSVEQVESWASKNPRAAAELISQMGAFSVADEAMTEVAQAWAKSDPEAALDFATTVTGKLGGIMASVVMEHWAAADHEAALKVVASNSTLARNASIARGLVTQWAKSAPEEALNWCHATLTGTTRTGRPSARSSAGSWSPAGIG